MTSLPWSMYLVLVYGPGQADSSPLTARQLAARLPHLGQVTARQVPEVLWQGAGLNNLAQKSMLSKEAARFRVTNTRWRVAAFTDFSVAQADSFPVLGYISQFCSYYTVLSNVKCRCPIGYIFQIFLTEPGSLHFLTPKKILFPYLF